MRDDERKIYDNAKRILERVRNAERAAGLSEGAVTLVAASKMNGFDAVREAYDAGIRDFGENRVQELVEKRRLDAYEGAAVHFIGHLQKNKAKDVVGAAELIHSADSLELLERIGRLASERGILQKVLVEVNIGSEPQKSGVAPEALKEFLDRADKIPGILVRGLMTIPPSTGKISETIHYFERMRNLFVDSGAKKYDNNIMSILSMGMSHDFEEAIRTGANVVRVGTAIFGPRTLA